MVILKKSYGVHSDYQIDNTFTPPNRHRDVITDITYLIKYFRFTPRDDKIKVIVDFYIQELNKLTQSTENKPYITMALHFFNYLSNTLNGVALSPSSQTTVARSIPVLSNWSVGFLNPIRSVPAYGYPVQSVQVPIPIQREIRCCLLQESIILLQYL